MFDMHCHLLPGIDDGPPTLAEALALAEQLVEDGMSHVVCTPHVFPGRFENRRSSIQEVFELFETHLVDAGIPLSISWAGEVRLTPEVLDELLPSKEIPHLGTSDGLQNVLLELPDDQIPLGAQRFTRRLFSAGIRPVIVHPERNRGVMSRIERLEPFIDEGCYVQITAGSLVGQFGTRAQATAHALVDSGWVHAIASDAHNLTGRRPRMKDGHSYLAAHWGLDAANLLSLHAPSLICGLHNTNLSSETRRILTHLSTDH